MRVLLDETPCEIDATYVGEAIAAAAELAEGRGRIIVDVQVDGQSWGDAQLSDLARDRTEADDVQLTTADPRALVSQTLGDASEVLAGADQLQREAAELIEANAIPEAMEKLREALGTWDSVVLAITMGGQMLNLDLEAVEVDGVPTHLVIAGLKDRLRMVRSALQSHDPIGLSDTLLYELPEIIQSWRDLLEQLQRTVQGEST